MKTSSGAFLLLDVIGLLPVSSLSFRQLFLAAEATATASVSANSNTTITQQGPISVGTKASPKPPQLYLLSLNQSIAFLSVIYSVK